MWLNIQSPHSDYRLCRAYNMIGTAEDLPAAIDALRPDAGEPTGSGFVPALPRMPFWSWINYPDTSIIFLAGVQTSLHAADFAEGYFTPNASQFATGCNSSAAEYASAVWRFYRLNLFAANKNVIVFGSSMGGAAACILSRHIRTMALVGRVRAVTIGAPKAFRSQTWPTLTEDQEKAWCNEGDPFCSLPALPEELAAFYFFLPILVTEAIGRFAHRNVISYLDSAGNNPTSIPNPWAGLNPPTNLASLVLFCARNNPLVHRTSVYTTRMGLMSARLTNPRTRDQVAIPQPDRTPRVTARELEVLGITVSNTPRGLEIPIANSGGTNDVRYYRIKRRGHKYLLLRGKYSLGTMISKGAARKVAKIGNRMMQPLAPGVANDPYAVDEALLAGYPVYFATA